MAAGGCSHLHSEAGHLGITLSQYSAPELAAISLLHRAGHDAVTVFS